MTGHLTKYIAELRDAVEIAPRNSITYALLTQAPAQSEKLSKLIRRNPRPKETSPFFLYNPITKLKAIDQGRLVPVVLTLVTEGLGYGIVPKSLSRIGTPEIVFDHLKESGVQIKHWLVWREQRTTPALNELIEMVTKDET